VKALFARKILKLGHNLEFALELESELQNYFIKRTASGNVQYASGKGHDDLTSSLEVACWYAVNQYEYIALIEAIELKRRHEDPSIEGSGRVSRGTNVASKRAGHGVLVKRCRAFSVPPQKTFCQESRDRVI
jgi:hypothetical protein